MTLLTKRSGGAMMVLKLACAAGGIVFARVRVVILAKRTPKARGDFKAFPPHSPHGFVVPLSKLSSREQFRRVRRLS